MHMILINIGFFVYFKVWHVTYLITIYPTELKLLDPIWITFIEGSLPVLIGVVKANKTNANIMKVCDQ